MNDPVTYKFCDERHNKLKEIMETRLKTIDRTLSEKAHLAEERIKSRTAMWGMAITVALIVIEVILYLSGKR